MAGTLIFTRITGAVIVGAVRRIPDKTRFTGVRWKFLIFRTKTCLNSQRMFTVATNETIYAIAMVRAHIVDTGSTISARTRETFINILLAVQAVKSHGTLTGVTSVMVEAFTIVQARIILALIDVYLAMRSSVSIEKIKKIRLRNFIKWIGFVMSFLNLEIGLKLNNRWKSTI